MNFSTGIPIHLFIREARQGNARVIEKVVRNIEELGYWGITIPDHILSTGVGHVGHEGEEQHNWRYADPLSLLAYLAAITSRVKLIPRVLVVPYRQPFSVAHALATIDSLSGGRLVLSLAPGYERNEFKIMGIPIQERGPMTDEYIHIMRELWSKPSVTFQGRYHSFEGASLLVRPVQQPHPPIWVGGNGKRALQRAVRIGDGWTPNCYVYPEVDPGVPNSLSRSQLVEAIRWSKQQRHAAGKPPLEYAVSSGPPLTILGKSRRAAPRAPSSIERFTCEGTPDELLEECQAFKDAGATSFVVNFTGNAPEDYLKDATTFARRVMGKV